MSLRRIGRAVRANRYEFTAHALEELDEDGLAESDVRDTLLRGRVVRELTNDPRGPLSRSEQTTWARRGGRRDMPLPSVGTLAYRHRVRSGGMMANRSDPCEYCGELVDDRERLVTVFRHRKGKHFIFERVPARVCSACGERYFSAVTVREMDRQMKKGKPGRVTVPVPVISLRAAG